MKSIYTTTFQKIERQTNGTVIIPTEIVNEMGLAKGDELVLRPDKEKNKIAIEIIK